MVSVGRQHRMGNPCVYQEIDDPTGYLSGDPRLSQADEGICPRAPLILSKSQEFGCWLGRQDYSRGR